LSKTAFLDVGKFNPYRVQRDLIDFEYRALCIQKADELNHRVQRDSRKLLPIPFTSIAGQELGALDVEEVGLHGGIDRHLSDTVFQS